MFAARYAFHQHLCDKHFKEALAQQVPLHPPYQCPVGGCAYIARDSRQSLIRHFGMTHKVIVELLKRHVPGNRTYLFWWEGGGSQPLVPLLLLGPPFFPFILFLPPCTCNGL
jgi:hypothetical protein